MTDRSNAPKLENDMDGDVTSSGEAYVSVTTREDTYSSGEDEGSDSCVDEDEDVQATTVRDKRHRENTRMRKPKP
jgi:hypothetical protein